MSIMMSTIETLARLPISITLSHSWFCCQSAVGDLCAAESMAACRRLAACIRRHCGLPIVNGTPTGNGHLEAASFAEPEAPVL